MRFKLELDAKYIERMASVDPRVGLREILWNASDADATEIRVTLGTNSGLGVEQVDVVTIKDNGHGLSLENAESALGKYGISEKTHKDKTPKGRRLHGKLGEGRYKAFSIGSHIKWISVYDDNGTKKKITVNFNGHSGTDIQISDPEITDESIGLTVSISLIDPNASNILLKKDEVVESILTSFAPYLMAHSDLKIIYDNELVDLTTAKQEERTKQCTYTNIIDNSRIEATISLIKWNKGEKQKFKYLCSSDGAALQEIPIKEQLPISIYIMSEYYEFLHKENSLSEMDEIAIFFDDEAEKLVQEYKDELRQSGGFEEIKYLKDNGIYPFKEDTLDTSEKEQMKLFDICTVKFYETVPTIKSAPKDVKRLTYNLLAEAIKTNPSSIKKILEEVFQLSKEQQDDFAKLLDQVSLSNIITTTKEVTDRLMFLGIIHDLVYTKLGTGVKERTQFHKMIERNLWIFGDTYKFGTSDRALHNVLKEHIKELERKELQPTVPDDAADDMNLIPDLCLWNKQRVDENLYENLVVELKRPNKVLGRKEFNQINDYANAVANNPAFDKTNYRWRFILIGKDFDQTLTNQLARHKDEYIGNLRVSILKWSELISKNNLRYQFYEDNIKLDPSNEMVVKQIDTVFCDLFSTK